MALAVQYQQAGQFAQAEQLLRQVVQAAPSHADAWRRLGACVHALGRLDEAITDYQQALRFQPDFAEAFNDLGIALAQTGRLDEAIQTFQDALRHFPDNADAANNLGVVLGMRGSPDEAATYLRQALRVKPSNPDYHSNLGNVLRDCGRYSEAEASYRQSLALNSNSPQTHNGLAIVLHEQGKLTEAEAHYRESLRLLPTYFKAHHGLGLVLADVGKPAEAEAHYREALRFQPRQPETHFALGVSLLRQARFADAMASFQQALYLNPNYAQAHNSLGNALLEQGRHDEAEASYRRALQLRPDLPEAHNNLANALADQGKLDQALAEYREALRLKPSYAEAHSNLLLHLNYHPAADPESVVAEHRAWDCRHGQASPPAPHGNRPDPERRLRVGYVTPDLMRHPVSKFFVEPILAHHDSRLVETVCYAEVPQSLSARVRGLAHGWRAIAGLTDAQVADQMRADGIDILVDLAGHTVNNRLRAFTYKPAPVQITYLGYPNTTGLRTMDYRITDKIADPPGEPVRQTEELVRLPGAFCCYAPPDEAPTVTPSPARQKGQVTFGSPHHLAKLNADVLDLWCRILHALPAARLLVFRHTLKGKLKEDLQRRFAERGIGSDRVELQTATDMTRAFLGWYGAVDITLDAFPWSSHTTACDSLWMGVPLLTLSGTTHAARMATSVLKHLGLDDLVATTPEEYLARALELASDVDRLARMRSTLRERLRESPLCNGRGFTHRLEDVYRDVWRRWCARAETR
jgi:predicted O-linked N-acetylglucosamine transferase (SPINDLY family)